MRLPRGRLVLVVAPPVQCGVRVISDDPPVDEALVGRQRAPTRRRRRRARPSLLLSTVFRIGAGLGICGFALLPLSVLTKGWLLRVDAGIDRKRDL